MCDVILLLEMKMNSIQFVLEKTKCKHHSGSACSLNLPPSFNTIADIQMNKVFAYEVTRFSLVI